MNKTCIMGKVKSSCKLNRNIVERLEVGARNVNCQVKIEPFDVLEDASWVVYFNHGELAAWHFVDETVKCSDDVWVSLQVDPILDVLFIMYLPHYELCSEIFVIDNKSSIRHDVLNLLTGKMVVKQYCLKSSNEWNNLVVRVEEEYLRRLCLREHANSNSWEADQQSLSRDLHESEVKYVDFDFWNLYWKVPSSLHCPYYSWNLYTFLSNELIV